MSLINRRHLFQSAGLALAVAQSARGANDRISLGIVGLGGRGRDLLAEFGARPDCRITALCDVHQPAREQAATLVQRWQGVQPKLYPDMRDLFADSSVDAVAIAAPNHWHALATIWACQAGKDVYVEKPACHEPWEGAQMVAAARKYRRIVQVGTQSRSQGHKIEAVRRLREGAIGKVYLVKGVCFKRRPSIGRTPEAPVPPGLDWDLFLGPAPVRPFTANRFKYNWHWFWDTGNGDIANQGAHEMDIARWGLGRDGYPQSVFSTGGKFAYDDDQETPNTQVAALDYGDAQILFEVRGLPAVPEENVMIGNLFYGSEGLMALDVYGFRIYRGDVNHKILDEKYREPKPWATGPHVENFLRAVRSRNPAALTAPVETGVLSANLCHLANISYRTGRKLSIDSPLGIAGDAGAQRLLRRAYRKPYVVPEVV